MRLRLYISPFPSYFGVVRKCPTCGKAVEWKANPWRPFCSERCKLIDFGKWTDEEYRVPDQRIDPANISERLKDDKYGDEEKTTD